MQHHCIFAENKQKVKSEFFLIIDLIVAYFHTLNVSLKNIKEMLHLHLLDLCLILSLSLSVIHGKY